MRFYNQVSTGVLWIILTFYKKEDKQKMFAKKTENRIKQKQKSTTNWKKYNMHLEKIVKNR